ncbi:hypothetical protein BV25DRAFT_1878461 [Artomyces pyxidatus]|uniref:Uncharacterized protein n=1 Tax=Artomyces pyxidatus TaxID=48021 RepID=A0ACB8TDK6_9AGAM|nr:hypothetical protein BV25DRAFT_1878461 [Artomyces pyxidatus]
MTTGQTDFCRCRLLLRTNCANISVKFIAVEHPLDRGFYSDRMALFQFLRGGSIGGRDKGRTTTAKNKLTATISPAVELLKYANVPKASEMRRKAFYDDPVDSYVWRTPDMKQSWRGAVLRSLRTISTNRMIARYVRKERALTILQGRALILFTPPASSLTLRVQPSPFPKDILNQILLFFMTPQQKRRVNEVDTKHQAAFESVIGDQADKLFYVDLLCTDPSYQGQGLASMLLNTVLQMVRAYTPADFPLRFRPISFPRQADEAGRPAWLGSSNIRNTPFYESFGFRKMAEIVIGDDDPDWEREPFIALVVSL